MGIGAKIAFTGHRSSSAPGRRPADLQAMRMEVRRQLQESGAEFFYGSVAEGADIIACEEALALGLSLQLYLPLPVEEFREDFADRMEAWPLAAALIGEAHTDERHSLTILNGMRPECYAEVNDHLLAHADLLLALTTDSDPKTGGASEMVSIAKAKGVPCIIINPLTREIRHH